MGAYFCPHIFVKCSRVLSTHRFIEELPCATFSLRKMIYDFLNPLFQSSAKAQTDVGVWALGLWYWVLVRQWTSLFLLMPVAITATSTMLTLAGILGLWPLGKPQIG